MQTKPVSLSLTVTPDMNDKSTGAGEGHRLLIRDSLREVQILMRNLI